MGIGFGLVWFGMVWFGFVWFCMVWFGMVCCSDSGEIFRNLFSSYFLPTNYNYSQDDEGWGWKWSVVPWARLGVRSHLPTCYFIINYPVTICSWSTLQSALIKVIWNIWCKSFNKKLLKRKMWKKDKQAGAELCQAQFKLQIELGLGWGR